MSDKTIAMADNQTKRMDAHDHNRLRLQETNVSTEKKEAERKREEENRMKVLEQIKIEEALKKLDEYLQVKNLVTQGLCGHCGSEFSGIFKKCKKCGKDKSDINLKKYNDIGNIAPAGGIIFYDKGKNSDGWRYLEVAPVNTEFKAEWGAFVKYVSGTETGIGYGKSNTQIIAKFLNNIRESGKAAQRCLALNINGYNDWFLPSKKELNEIYRQRNIIGGFNIADDSRYWSSSQGHDYNTWSQNFDNGSQNANYKNNTYRVRAVRAF